MLNYFKFVIILYATRRCNAIFKGVDYVMMPDEKYLMKPCESSMEQNINTDDLWQSNFEYDYDDDMETIVSNGNITFKVDMEKVEMNLEAFVRKRGNWELTLYYMKRKDFCTALFDPNELWYPITKSIPEEERICPPKTGTIYHFYDMKHRIDIHNVRALEVEGEYKLVVNFLINDRPAICMESVIEVWRN